MDCAFFHNCRCGQLTGARPHLVRSDGRGRLAAGTLSGAHALGLGGITCRRIHVGGDHAADSIVVHIPEERITFLSDCRYEDLYVELTAEAVRLRLVGETVTRMGADRVAVLAALAQELGQPPDEDTLAFADAFLAGL